MSRKKIARSIPPGLRELFAAEIDTPITAGIPLATKQPDAEQQSVEANLNDTNKPDQTVFGSKRKIATRKRTQSTQTRTTKTRTKKTSVTAAR
jgi:hypothetical protein